MGITMKKFAVAALLMVLALPAQAASSSSSSSSSSNSSSSNSSSSESHSSSSLSQDDARDALKRGAVMPLTAILEIVNKRAPGMPGTVLDVELETENGVLSYKIHLLTDAGRKEMVRVNARTGDMLEVLVRER